VGGCILPPTSHHHMSRPRAAEQALDEDDDSSGDPSSSEESCDAPVPESSETPQGRQQSGKLRETLAPQPTREDTKTAPEKKKVKSKHKYVADLSVLCCVMSRAGSACLLSSASIPSVGC
jgi:hypothetical protein